MTDNKNPDKPNALSPLEQISVLDIVPHQSGGQLGEWKRAELLDEMKSSSSS